MTCENTELEVRQSCDHRGREGNYVAINKGTGSTADNHKKPGERAWSCHHLDFRLLAYEIVRK